MSCSADGCENESVMSWQRYATEAELLALGVPPENIQAAIDDGTTLMVYACADHLLAPDLMAMVHASACPAPPDCTCSVATTLPIPMES